VPDRHPSETEEGQDDRISTDLLGMVQRAGLLADERGSPGSRSASRAGVFLLRVLVYMNEHAGSRETTIDSIAAAQGVTRRYLEMNFAKVGETPAGMLRSFRIGIARAVMLRSDPPEPIAKVAELAGFGSVSAFTRAFRRETGSTPAAWRRRHLRAGQDALRYHVEGGLELAYAALGDEGRVSGG